MTKKELKHLIASLHFYSIWSAKGQLLPESGLVQQYHVPSTVMNLYHDLLHIILWHRCTSFIKVDIPQMPIERSKSTKWSWWVAKPSIPINERTNTSILIFPMHMMFDLHTKAIRKWFTSPTTLLRRCRALRNGNCIGIIGAQSVHQSQQWESQAPKMRRWMGQGVSWTSLAFQQSSCCGWGPWHLKRMCPCYHP